MNNRVILLILDGWGQGTKYPGNAIELANTPNFDALIKKYPNSLLHTSGEWVGLPDGQMGNSEVGHMNIGAGRVVYQQLVLIDKMFREHKVADNNVLKHAIAHAKGNNKKIHLMGLLSDGGVHSSINHLKGLCSILKENDFDNFYLHAFTDGRDTDPNNGVKYLADIMNHLEQTNGKLASVIGRYYAMDRDNRWERIKLAYDLMVNGIGEKTHDVLASIQHKYAEGETDEFLKPLLCVDENNHALATMEPNDVVICFNFRTDRGREITQALTQHDFVANGMFKIPLHYITLTNYDKTFENVNVMFADIELNNTLGEVLQTNHKKQVRIAETEKYPHVTFFFSGGRESLFKGEVRHMAPSPKDVPTYDFKPEMNAEGVCQFTLDEIAKNEADFMCVNFANPDMVGHTGVIAAEIKAVEKVDECLGRIIEAGLANNYTFLITADHGNGEFMMNPDGSANTAHTTNDVPLILVGNHIPDKINDGKLADLAPTTLALIGLHKPKEMDGESLLA
ncbi:MAG: 2,3-bisphosphoglycerate-independent phosphoglycerate mutase [Bacteroidota bacterium]